MTDFKTLQNITYGSLNFSIYERQGQFGPQKSFVLSKRVYKKDTQKFEKIGQIGLDKLADLSTVL